MVKDKIFVLSDDCRTLLSVADVDVREIIVPEGVEVIDKNAFEDCVYLQRITIPSTVTFIFYECFDHCPYLHEIVVARDNPIYCSLNGDLYNKTLTQILKAPSDYTCYKRLFNVEAINAYAFYGCGIEHLILPENLKLIGNNAFSYCVSLQDVNIPDSVISIGDNAFGGCVSLKQIMIPNSVRTIGKGAFDGCLQLESIYFKENNPYFIYIDGVLYNREFNTIIQILKASKVINKYVISNHIISIGYGAFFNCCLLETIDIPLGVLSIGAYAFELCTMLKNINMPSSVTILGEYAFKNCVRLECVDFSPNIEKINRGLFSGCECLENIFIPNNVVSIEDYAFENCKSLQIIDISENIKKIGNYAFYGCISLKSIHMHITNIEKCDIENNVFDGVNFDECILYVPLCTRWAYLNHSTFKQFKNIIPLRQ